MIPSRLPRRDRRAGNRPTRAKTPCAPRAEPYGPTDERDVVLLDRRRLALLLRHATALRLCAQGAPLPFPIEPRPLEVWRAEARQVLALASVRGRALGGPSRLAGMLGADPLDWPAPSELAEWARSLDDGELSRICVGWAWLHEGDCARAERTFAGLLQKLHLLRHRWRVLEGLGHVHAELGRWRLAHAALEAAAESPRSAVGVLVEALHMALRVGDPALIGRAAARLDLLIDPRGADFEAALAFFARRVARYGEWSSSESAAQRLFEGLLRARSAPSGRVARALSRE
jgi:hypothetical protein